MEDSEMSAKQRIDAAEKLAFLALCQELHKDAALNLSIFIAAHEDLPGDPGDLEDMDAVGEDQSAAAEAAAEVAELDEEEMERQVDFGDTFTRLLELIDMTVEPLSDRMFDYAPEYDFKDLRANGFRSLLTVVRKCLAHLLTLSRYIRLNRDRLLFRGGHYRRELQAYVTCLSELCNCLYYADKLTTFCDQMGCLFPSESSLSEPAAEKLMTESECISQEAFYGRCLGFHFCPSMQRPLTTVMIAMAAFADNFEAEQNNEQYRYRFMRMASTFAKGGRYAYDSEQRAHKVVQMTRNASIDFCKAFWGIAEHPLMQQLPMMVCPQVAVSEVFLIPPENFSLSRSRSTSDVTIPPPVAHTGPGGVKVRLISHTARIGQEWLIGRDRTLSPPSTNLVIHCHGGGFVAQSSRSHEIYLRNWAKVLDSPILSVDYSLAPESPFPRALEEIFFAYAWAVKNAGKLGSTGEKILVCGDSAGGNLLIAATLRAIQYNIRLPDGIFCAYTPVLVRFIPSPSRLLAIADPLLPVGILSRCLLAYAGIDEVQYLKEVESKTESLCSPGDEDIVFSWDRDTAISSGVVSSAQNLDMKKTSPKKSSPMRLTKRSSGGLRSGSNGSTSAEDLHLLWAERHHAQSPVDTPLHQIRHAHIPPDPFMSPLLCDDILLSKLPRISLVACHFDPCLDDNVEFSKRLDSLGVDVSLDVLEDVPHGFLNFVLISREAGEGNQLCLERMKDLLNQ